MSISFFFFFFFTYFECKGEKHWMDNQSYNVATMWQNEGISYCAVFIKSACYTYSISTRHLNPKQNITQRRLCQQWGTGQSSVLCVKDGFHCLNKQAWGDEDSSKTQPGHQTAWIKDFGSMHVRQMQKSDRFYICSLLNCGPSHYVSLVATNRQSGTSTGFR